MDIYTALAWKQNDSKLRCTPIWNTSAKVKKYLHESKMTPSHKTSVEKIYVTN